MLENHGQPLCTSEIQIWQIEKSLRSYSSCRAIWWYQRFNDNRLAMIGEWYMRRSPPWRDVYWPPAWNCQNAKGCIVADKATGCEIWDRLRSAKWFRKWWEYKINPFCCRRTIVGALIVEWKFYSLHFDNTWLRINKW